MIVECINDEFDFSNYPNEFIKNMIKVGDLELFLPKKGQQYEVIGSYYGYEKDGDKVVQKEEGYELLGLDTSHYGGRLFFVKSRFKVIDDSFVPNYYNKQLDAPCRTHNMYFDSIMWEMKIPTINRR